MKKIILLLAVATGSVFAGTSDVDLILSEPWFSAFSEPPYRITFKENTYEMTLLGPGGPSCSAPYSISGTKIQLGSGDESCKKQTCKIIDTLDAIEGSRGLKCGKLTYYTESDKPPKGKAVKIKGVSAISMGQVTGSTTTKVVIRSGPSKTSKPVSCSGTVPDTLQLTVFARTSAKVKVDSWNNYWYYVLVHGDENSFDCGNLPRWIFGEFIKVQ